LSCRVFRLAPKAGLFSGEVAGLGLVRITRYN
jgi:hypothetical protein